MCAAKGRPPTGHGVYFFPPVAPLRRGGVYPLKAGGAERCAVLYGAERRGPPEGTRTYLVPSPYISPLVAFRKRGATWSFMVVRARECGRVSGQATHVGLVSIGGRMMIGGGLARWVARDPRQGRRGVARAGGEWHHFARLKVLRAVLWLLRSRCTYFQLWRARSWW